MSALYHRFECSGESRAHAAGREAPRCWICDQFVEDLSTMTLSHTNQPVCAPCRADIDAHLEASRKADAAALFRAFDPRETRASSLLRAQRVNPHGD